MRRTLAILTGILGALPATSYASSPDEIIKFIQGVCLNPSQYGKYLKVSGTADPNAGVDVNLDYLKITGTVEFTKEEWEGVQQVLYKDRAVDNKSYRECIEKITPVFVQKFSDNPNTEENDNKECEERSVVNYGRNWQVSGILGIMIAPIFVIGDKIDAVTAQNKANQIFRNCMENKGYISDGTGYHEFSNGNKYDGEWKNFSEDGQGTFFWKDGSIYKGYWKNGKRNGNGSMNFSNGNKYEGEWEDDNFNGKGIFYFKQGGNYTGEWKNGHRDGRGVDIYTNGDKYEGDWKDDVRNGYGTLTFANGEVKSGFWKDDVLLKEEDISEKPEEPVVSLIATHRR